MSEWLTTGEMIDRLKVGDVAEHNCANVRVYFQDGKLKRDVSGTVIDFLIHENTPSVKWRILPKYVSFEEAMKAFVNGIKVKVELFEQKEVYEYQLIDGVFHYRNLKRGDDEMYRASEASGIGIRGVFIAKGKWTIEEDSND